MLALFSTMSCTSNILTRGLVSLGYACYSEIHIIFIAGSALIICLRIALSLLDIILFTDEEPDSKLPWACSSILHEFYILLRKLTLSVFFFIAKDNLSLGAAGLAIGAILSLLCMRELYINIYMKDKKVQFALYAQEGSITWLTLIGFLYLVEGTNLGNPIVLVLVVAILILTVILLNKERTYRILMLKTIEKLKDVQEVKTFCRILMESLYSKKSSPGIVIEGIIMLHVTNCTLPHCSCKMLALGNGDESEDQCQNAQNDNLPGCDSKISNRKQSLVESNAKNNFKELNDKNPVEELTDSEKRKLGLTKIMIAEVAKWNIKQERRSKLHIFVGYLKMNCFKSNLRHFMKQCLQMKEILIFMSNILLIA